MREEGLGGRGRDVLTFKRWRNRDAQMQGKKEFLTADKGWTTDAERNERANDRLFIDAF